MKGRMEIRPAELADIHLCHQLNTAYATNYVWQMQTQERDHTITVRFDTVRLPRPMLVEYPRSPDELAEHWRQKGCLLVAAPHQDEVAGFLDGQPRPWQGQLWIWNLVVDQEYRQAGLGTSLLEKAAHWARRQELRQLVLEMQTKNHPAISFAQKHSFQFCGYNDQYYPNGDIALFFSRSI
jgi:ribosomal protein S18 acetylase RimI-like enzyme